MTILHMAAYSIFNAIWQDAGFSGDNSRQHRRCARCWDKEPRLIADDLGETPMSLVPVEARRRPTSQFEPLRAINEAALERKRFAAFDLHRPPSPDHRIDDLRYREGMFVFKTKRLAQFGHAMERNLPA